MATCARKRERERLLNRQRSLKEDNLKERDRKGRIQPACKQAGPDVSGIAQKDEECYGKGAGWNSKKLRSLGVL